MSSGDYGPETSPSLLLRIRDPDDTDSWQTFEHVYAPVIRGYCQRRGFQASDIDDIAQEVLTAVARAIQTFEYEPQRGKFRSWLATVTANKLKDFVSRHVNPGEQLDELAHLAASPDTNTEWSTVFLNRVFEAACERVRPHFEDRSWHCFEATWMNHRQASEVADELQMPIHSVYVNKSRVLKRLEQEFLMLSDDFPAVEVEKL